MYSVHNACATQQAKLLQHLFEHSLSFKVVLAVWKQLCNFSHYCGHNSIPFMNTAQSKRVYIIISAITSDLKLTDSNY